MSDYTSPSEAYINQCSYDMQRLLVDFVNRHTSGFVADIQIDMDALGDCILRVHQREHYFKIFHDMPKGLSEVKRVSLFCFWLMKYKPFMLLFDLSHVKKDENLKKQQWWKRYFLERFCCYLLTMLIRGIYKGVQKLPLSAGGIKDFVYSLRHHDITKEVLTEIFELLEDVVKLGHSTDQSGSDKAIDNPAAQCPAPPSTSPLSPAS